MCKHVSENTCKTWSNKIVGSQVGHSAKFHTLQNSIRSSIHVISSPPSVAGWRHHDLMIPRGVISALWIVARASDAETRLSVLKHAAFLFGELMSVPQSRIDAGWGTYTTIK